MFIKYPLTSRFAIFLLAPAFIFLSAGFIYYAIGSLPETNDALYLDGLIGKSSIKRDSRGVAYIEADNDRDVYFTTGFAHAQDRLWQLEVQRRLAQGRLSEIFGRTSLEQDIWIRTLGIYNAAETTWHALTPEAQQSLIAYAEGINAWIDTHNVLPPEFYILGVNITYWKPVDSLAWLKIFALNQSNSMWMEAKRYVASQYLNTDQLKELFRDYPEGAPVTISQLGVNTKKSLAYLLGVQHEIQTQLKIGGKFVGSNAWVISGNHTASGNPILANDPHMELQVPSLWYALSQKGKTLDAAGMNIVGLPNVVFGRNANISWAGTNMQADTQDLFLQQVNPANQKQYRFQDKWETFSIREETIHVKPDVPAKLRTPIEPVKIQIRSTKQGPIISDLYKFIDQPVALSWTGLTPNDTSYETLFKLSYAHNWSEFKLAASYFVAPALNLLYADNHNNIGYLGIGSIPLRKSDKGALPVPGWVDDYQWSGYVPTEESPKSFNPAKGYLISANNKVISDDYPYFISMDWASPARAQRIEQLLKTKMYNGRRTTVADSKRIQADQFDLEARSLLSYFKTINFNDSHHQRALKYLLDWDGNMIGDSPGATIFYVWAKYLRKRLLLDELKGYWNSPEDANYLQSLSSGVTNSQLLHMLTRSKLGWCDNVNTHDKVENCQFIAKQALNDALRELEKLAGSNPTDWNWGLVHKTLYTHIPFSRINLLDVIFERRLSNGGSLNSINVADASYRKSKGYEQSFGAAFRQIVQLHVNEKKIKHLFMNSPGQSGNIVSDHYDDLLVKFRDVDYLSFHDINKETTESVIILNPK